MKGLDALEDSPVLDIKPYPEWVSGRLIVVTDFRVPRISPSAIAPFPTCSLSSSAGPRLVLLPVLLQRPWLYHAKPSLRSPVLESLPSSKAKGSEGIRPVAVKIVCEQDPSAMPQDDKKSALRGKGDKNT